MGTTAQEPLCHDVDIGGFLGQALSSRPGSWIDCRSTVATSRRRQRRKKLAPAPANGRNSRRKRSRGQELRSSPIRIERPKPGSDRPHWSLGCRRRAARGQRARAARRVRCELTLDRRAPAIAAAVRAIEGSCGSQISSCTGRRGSHAPVPPRSGAPSRCSYYTVVGLLRNGAGLAVTGQWTALEQAGRVGGGVLAPPSTATARSHRLRPTGPSEAMACVPAPCTKRSVSGRPGNAS